VVTAVASESNVPPVVSYSVRSTVPEPTVYGACAVIQRWPAAPLVWPASAYVYQPTNA